MRKRKERREKGRVADSPISYSHLLSRPGKLSGKYGEVRWGDGGREVWIGEVGGEQAWAGKGGYFGLPTYQAEGY